MDCSLQNFGGQPSLSSVLACQPACAAKRFGA
jgi:hypothetical protein